MLPMQGRLRALMVGDADRHEKHADRDQQEAHGKQTGAGYAAPIARDRPRRPRRRDRKDRDRADRLRWGRRV